MRDGHLKGFWEQHGPNLTQFKVIKNSAHRTFKSGSRFLDYLFLIFGISIAVATVAFLGATSAPQVHELKFVVIVIEAVGCVQTAYPSKVVFA